VIAAIGKALELDESLAEAHTALGAAKSFYDRDWRGAEKEFRRAIELNPNYATARTWYSQILASEGRHDEAVAESKRALELDPVSLIINAGWGHRLYRARRYDEAVSALNVALELDPNFYSTRWNLGMAYAQQKKFDAAIRELQKAEALSQQNALVLGGLTPFPVTRTKPERSCGPSRIKPRPNMWTPMPSLSFMPGLAIRIKGSCG
jgi:tetratricopeptide (TPR) repeat protein